MKGSIWRKWDLHLHTPKTKLSNHYILEGKDEIEVWKEYCKLIEESDVSAFGITDYFCCENYFEFLSLFKSNHPQSRKVFFLNIEFRLPVAVNRQGEEVNIHIIFDNKVQKSKIDEFLLNLKTSDTDENGANIKCKNLTPDKFISATISIEEINRGLKEVFGTNKPYLIVAAANNAGLRPTRSPRKLSITDEIDKKCDAFFGGVQNVDYYMSTDRYEEPIKISKPKPVLSGCDAHSFDDLKLKLGKKLLDDRDNSITICDNTWIKADLSFEGLKQVLYEPKHRIVIQETEPRNSTRKIEYINFNFPANIKIQRKDSSDVQEFCLKNIRGKLEFSNYFTCLVGGRGTGKSTIINLLAEKLNEESDFFANNFLTVDNKQYDLRSDNLTFVELEGTNEIEFVSQGKIEQLAEGNRLTNLVFDERIKNLDSNFEVHDNRIELIKSKIDSNIKIIDDIDKKDKLKKDKNNEKDTFQKIIDSVNDVKYKEISNAISTNKEEVNALKASKNSYSELLKDIKNLINKYPTSEKVDDYSKRYNEILNILTTIDEVEFIESDTIIVEKNFESVNDRLELLNQSFDTEIKKLKSFFEEKGTSEEVIKDSQNANEKISLLNQEILKLETEIKNLLEEYKENESITKTYVSLSKEYSQLISSNLDIINSRLDIQNENLLKINFDTYVDNEKIEEYVFDEFYNKFLEYHISGTSKSDVKRALLELKLSDVVNLDYNQFRKELESKIFLNFNRATNYIKIIEEIFKSRANFIIYKLIITKHIYDVPTYIKFKGFYGDKDLKSCSFGQRCTAVVVTLLMTGIKPLIIDEPEAHLDNKLIAEYLVELIKTKKPDRQIIFATHNSNFVINGDAELIHILEIPHKDLYTNVTSTTIEDLSNRERLLRLEGGKEAFKTRESKYDIQ
ncbi:TrlF family AAA-like ATPase [Sphingobacterium sp. UBA1498]|uniref:TrlF family AAA-like ATPase n=1 Tax=Sphingobacterium sp. UBA1498 TaxID=1947481 RepID=UPI0025FAE0BC|nr:AAA family ATPase [Sphingobacterium sp. UBA1498]